MNIHLTAANGLLDHKGRRDLQLLGQLDVVPEIQPELTRAEYLRLLQAAKGLSRERSYLLVKVFALTGIRVGELERVTAEAVKEGRLLITADGEQRYVPLPNCLRRELLDYLDRQRIRDGPVFVHPFRAAPAADPGDGGDPGLCRDACVEESKGSPRCPAAAVSGRPGEAGGQRAPAGGAGPGPPAGGRAADRRLGPVSGCARSEEKKEDERDEKAIAGRPAVDGHAADRTPDSGLCRG